MGTSYKGKQDSFLSFFSQQHLTSFHQLWDPDTLNCKHQINSQHTSFVYDIAIQGEELLSCSADRTVKLWDLNNEGAHVHTFATADSKDDDWVLSVRWHPDKNTILWFVYPPSTLLFNWQVVVDSGESHGLVRIWDKRTVDPVHLLKLPPTPFTHNHVWSMAAVVSLPLPSTPPPFIIS